MLGQTFISRDIELPMFEGSDKKTVYELLKKVVLALLNEIIKPEILSRPAANKKRPILPVTSNTSAAPSG